MVRDVGRQVTVCNKRRLIDNGSTPSSRRARKLALDGVEHALVIGDPMSLLRSHLKLSRDTLKINGLRFELNRYRRIFVVGAGKASGRMAEYVESLLGERVTSGFVNVLKGTRGSLGTERIVLNEASHPIPDADGVRGAEEILSLAESAKSSDLVICLISGGGSALMPLPRAGVSLDDKQDVTRRLILSGADIYEINTVRKHLSGIKGGLLARSVYPATLISLILSDVVGDDVSVIASGPTAPDDTTFGDAVSVLKKYGVWEAAPEHVRRILEEGVRGGVEETPKPRHPCFLKVHNVVVGSNREVCKGLKQFYARRGLRSALLTSTLEGEARFAGYFLSSIVNEVSASKNPMAPPCALICGGETTVTVKGAGRGGRNQEVVLAALSKLRVRGGVALVSFGTDGVDGPTDAAGALIDGFSSRRASEKGLDVRRFLDGNDSYSFFSAMGDHVVTGPTGTNLNDIAIMIIL
ncbi:MAG: glycerate kinase [Candidatus Bathyarchaeia archaeon]